MLGKIISIEEDVTFRKIDCSKWSSSYDGYVVKTESSSVKVGISNGQCCCENWGYCASEDNIKDFIGSNLLNVQVTDTALDKTDVPEVYDGGVMFVDINTDKGTFQIVLYNEHNGYYGHDAVVLVDDKVTEEECL